MKRVLFATTLPPWPAVSGGRQRTWEFLLELSALARVTLLHPESPGAAETESALAGRPVEVLRGLPPRRSLLTYSDAYFRDYPWHFAPYVEALEGDFLSRSDEADLVYIDHLHLAPLAFLKRPPGVKFLLDAHNVESRLHRAHAGFRTGLGGFLARRYAAQVERFERAALERFDSVTCPSEADRQGLIELGADPARTHVVPNGAHFPDAIPPASASRTLLAVGTLAWPPAVEGLLLFYHRVYRRLRAKLPDLALVVAGSGPPLPAVRALETDPSVTLRVDFKDAREIYALGNVCVAPSVVPGGTKIKVAEGLLHGRYVVATAEAAVGIAPRPHLETAEGIDALEAPLLNLLSRNRLPAPDRAAFADLAWDRARLAFRRRVGEALR